MNSINAIQNLLEVPSKLDKTETAVAASKLATARTINGTSFNGTSNITTSTWGTSRNITIGNTTRAINGSGNASWSLSDIGAAASSHTHSYLPLSGGTINGSVAMNGNINMNGSINMNGNKINFGTNPNDTDDEANISLVHNGVDTTMQFKVGNNGYIDSGTGDRFLWVMDNEFYGEEGMEDYGRLTAELVSEVIIFPYIAYYVDDVICRYSINADYGYFKEMRVNGDIDPTTNGEHSLGWSSYRWLDVYCTRAAWNGSDISLKEDIKFISKNDLLNSKNNKRTILSSNEENKQVTSKDLYDYVKNSNTYSFRYKNTDEEVLGIIANEIPENIFSLIGQYTKTEEEFEQEKIDREEKIIPRYNELLEKGIYDKIGEDKHKLHKRDLELDMEFGEIKEKALNEPEAPVRLMNSSAQTAMLQEVLSIALNKIDEQQEQINKMQKQIDELLAK